MKMEIAELVVGIRALEVSYLLELDQAYRRSADRSSRRLPIDLTALTTSLLDTCTPQSCPQMKADEWQYLCVAHGSEGAEECTAIDYILHT